MTFPQDNLLTRLGRADVVCKECGTRYGKYSVGCSSTWVGTCGVCGESKPVTEVRDYGYLSKGINELKGNIQEQSKVTASYMASVGPIMNDDELEDALTASYEVGEITLKLTEEEVAALSELAEDHCNNYPGAAFESLWEKIEDLYQDYCVKYELSPALKAYNAKYGTWGSENDEEMKRWEGFRDAFVMLEGGK
jgi:hypothetical protein